MAVELVAVATNTRTGLDPANLTVAVPTGTEDGHYMLAAVAGNSDWTAPGGWTQLFLTTFNTLRWGLWRRDALSEPADYTWTVNPSNRAAVIATFRQQDAAAPHIVSTEASNRDTSAPGLIDVPGTGGPVVSETTGTLIRIGYAHNINGSFVSPGATIEEAEGTYTLIAEPIANGISTVAMFMSDFERTSTNYSGEEVTFNNSSGTQDQGGASSWIRSALLGTEFMARHHLSRRRLN